MVSYVYVLLHVNSLHPTPGFGVGAVAVFCVTVYDAEPPPGIVAVELYVLGVKDAAVFGDELLVTVPKIA
jgi:hypothetical protein